MRIRPRLMALLAALILSSPCFAQTRPADCVPAGQAAAAPARGSGDGTAPRNAGSTGGTAGSQTGTTPSGATAAARTWQPPTARGLDPLAAPARTARAC